MKKIEWQWVWLGVVMAVFISTGCQKEFGPTDIANGKSVILTVTEIPPEDWPSIPFTPPDDDSLAGISSPNGGGDSLIVASDAEPPGTCVLLKLRSRSWAYKTGPSHAYEYLGSYSYSQGWDASGSPVRCCPIYYIKTSTDVYMNGNYFGGKQSLGYNTCYKKVDWLFSLGGLNPCFQVYGDHCYDGGGTPSNCDIWHAQTYAQDGPC